MNKHSSKIFGSPPEPYFSVSELYLSSDILEDGLKTLADKNQELINKTTDDDNYFKDGKSVELIFNITKKLDLPLEVRFLAVELFDKFMLKHVNELYEIVVSSSSKEKQLDWSSVEARIIDQVPLRAVTCIQLASKLVSHYKALTPSKVKRFLLSCGLQYSIASVVKSEQRVLRTLDFRLVSSSPLTYIEILLEVLRRNCRDLQVNILHDVSITLLDVTYLQKIYIYQLLAASSDTEFDLKSTNDHLFLAASIIIAAGYLIDAESNDKLMEQVSLITCIEEADLIVLATVLVKVGLEE